jgi:hypothetical protein
LKVWCRCVVVGNEQEHSRRSLLVLKQGSPAIGTKLTLLELDFM